MRHDDIVKMEIGRLAKELNRLDWPCFQPGCMGHAIRSHSQQKARQLAAIAEDGLVIARTRDVYRFSHSSIDPYEVRMQLTGIGKTSTFPGFCSQHDREVFAPLETEPLDSRHPRQAVLLFLRSLCYEVSQKRMAQWLNRQLLARLRGILAAEAAHYILTVGDGVTRFLDREAPVLLSETFHKADSGHPRGFHTCWHTVEKVLPLSCSTVFCPWLFGFYERRMRDRDCFQPTVSLNVIPQATCTHIVFSWLARDNQHSRWITRKTLKPAGLEPLLNLIGFTETEDMCLRPSFWQGLPEETKRFVVTAMDHDCFRGPVSDCPRIVRLQSNKAATH